MRRRREDFRAELSRRGLSHALVYGANRSGSAVSWLTGWPVTREALLVVGPAEADDVFLVSFYNHVPQARRMSRVPVEWGGRNPITTALERLGSGGARLARVGLAGPLPFWHYRTLADAAGGMHHIHYLGVTGMDGPSVSVPAQWPTSRRIRRGDVVTCEISVAVAPEYAGQLLRTFTVGTAPTPLYARLHEVAEEAFEAIHARLVPGTHARELMAAGAVVEAAGYTAIDDLVHGFGGGYLPPVIDGPGRTPVFAPDLVLAAGMTVVVQPNVVTRDLSAALADSFIERGSFSPSSPPSGASARPVRRPPCASRWSIRARTGR
jgi:Xaa-Pro aminopeptidase